MVIFNIPHKAIMEFEYKGYTFFINYSFLVEIASFPGIFKK